MLDRLSKKTGSAQRTVATASTALTVPEASSPSTASTTSGTAGLLAAKEHASSCRAAKASGTVR